MPRAARVRLPALFVLALGCAAAGEDRIFLKGEEEKPKTGTILADDFRGIKFRSDSAESSISRERIARTIYGLPDGEPLQRAVDLLAEGKADEARKALDSLATRAGTLPDAQKKLFGQHVLYHRAACLLMLAERSGAAADRQKLLKEAETGFSSLLANAPESAFVTDAQLSRGRIKELLGARAEARSHFDMIATKEFQKLQEAGGAMDRPILLARLAVMRFDADAIAAKGGQDEKIRKIAADLSAMRADKSWEKNAGPAEKAEAVRVEATVLLALKDFEKLSTLLGGAIREAVKEDDRDLLTILYSRRAAAHYELFKANLKDEAKKKDFGRRALLDYLRCELSYDLPVEESAVANLRLAEIFLELKEPEAKAKALEHVGLAKGKGVAPLAAQIEELAKRIKEMPDEAAKAEPKANK